MKDYYQILGVPRTAKQEEIKKVYRRLAKQYHPDLHKGDKQAEERFKDISEAYDILGDPEKRGKYDQFGQWSERTGGGGAYRQYTWSSGGEGPGFGDLGDIFEDLFGMAGFGARRRSRTEESPFRDRSRQAEQAVARDLHYTMDIDFLESVNGTEAKISVNRGGKQERINVKIPAGVHEGSKIRLAGKGEQGIMGNKGDLYITLKIKPHPYFRREGDDIYMDLPITLSEAILGTELKVPTISGHVSLKIPAGTSSGSRLRLKGRGAPRQKKSGRGDQYVIPKIVLPPKISENEEQLAREIADKSTYDPRAGKFSS